MAYVSPFDATRIPAESIRRLVGLEFNDSDDVIRAALDDVSVPALLMSIVHMTGDLAVLDELPKPTGLYAMDLQGGLDDDQKALVRTRAFDVARKYRDSGCPTPFVPNRAQLQRMLDVVTAGAVSEEFIDYIAADLRVSDADQTGPVLESSPQQRAEFSTVVIGCGEGGLLAGIKLKQAGMPFTIIEKQSGVGGTWLSNRYPGCRVDIPNQYYAYSFEPNDHWSQHYSAQPEILQYLNDVMTRHDIAPHIRFNTEVLGASWDDAQAIWTVTIRETDGDVDTLTARALICAVGQFSNPVIADIEGSGDFVGPSFHTTEWDDTVELAGKKVAVIGAGATGFQLVPAIADSTERVYVYQRTPQWIAPNPAYHDAVGEGSQWASRHLPFYGRWLRFVSWWPIVDGAASSVVIDPSWDDGGLSVSEENDFIRQIFVAWMRVFTDDEDLLEKITPQYPPMGKRTLQDNGTWVRTLQRDDVELVNTAIERITSDGIVTVDGVHRRADIIVWATGFDVNHQLGRLNISGLNGVTLSEAWGDAPYAFLGVTVPDFPNFFCIYGPGTNAVNGASIIYNSECQMRYIMSCIDLVLSRSAAAATPRADVCSDYIRRSQDQLRTMVYTHPAVKSSYYKNSTGDVPTLLGWRIVDYWKQTRQANVDDYELRGLK